MSTITSLPNHVIVEGVTLPHLPFLSLHGRLPPQLDGVRLRVGDAEVSDFEGRSKHGALCGREGQAYMQSDISWPLAISRENV